MADNECLGNNFSMGTIYRYIYGRMCIDLGKKHSILIRGYWHRVLCNELYRLLCAYLDQRAFQLDIITVALTQLKEDSFSNSL